MNMLFAGGAVLALIMLIFYPIFKFVDHMIFGQHREYRMREWKMLAAKLAMVEFQMIATINQIRAQKGLSPIPHEPVLNQFKGVGGWAGLKSKMEESIQFALNRMNWTQ